MQTQDPFPLIVPATHSAQDLAPPRVPAQLQPSFKDQSPENNLFDHAQPHQAHNPGHQAAKQAEKSMNSKVSMRKLKGPAGADSRHNGKISQIIRKKKELDEEIARLKYEEQAQKRTINKGFNRNMRSQITPEEKMAIRRALEERHKFQMMTSVKAQQLEQEIREKQQHEEKKMQEKIQSIRSQKRKQALNHLEVLKLKQIDRTKTMKEGNKKFEQTKLKTFLHEKMEASWESQIAQRQQRNRQILQAIRSKKHFSAQELKKHQQEFKQFMKKDDQQRKKNLSLKTMQKRQIQKQTLQKYQPSAFLKTVFEQQQTRKKQEHSRTLQLFANISKKSMFSETIRQVNKDSIVKRQTLSPIKEVNDKAQIDSASHNKSEKARSLSQVQLFKLGNNYMRHIHSSLTHVDEGTLKDRKKQERTHFKYDNYLKELKDKRAKVQSNPEVQQIRELKSLMKKQISMDQKWYKAKLLTSRLEQRSNLDTDTLLKSISTKIQMINSFRGN